MERPRWLAEQPIIVEFLRRVIDDLTRQTLDERTNRLRYRILRDGRRAALSALFDAGLDGDRIWHLVRQLADQYALFDIELDKKRGAYDPEFCGARLTIKDGAEALLRDWLELPKVDATVVAWQSAVARYAELFPGNLARLQSRPVEIVGLSPNDVVAAFARIGDYLTLRLTLRQLSARCFFGDSKQLDNLEELVLALFPKIELATRPVVVNVYLPAHIDAVLFIENQDTYALALRGAWPVLAQFALVYSAGFKGSAQRIRERDGVSLHVHASSEHVQSHSFQTWWHGETVQHTWPAYFWGDLDFSGMGILKALRARFPTMRVWQPGYAPMVEALKMGSGHTAYQDRQQSDPGGTGCTYSDEVLLPLLREKMLFIDQEIVDLTSLLPLAFAPPSG